MLNILTVVVTVLSFFIGLFASYRTSDKAILVLTFYLFLCFVATIVVYTFSLNGINNIFVFHFLPIFEFICLLIILSLWDKDFIKVYLTVGIVVGIEILIDAIITPIDQVPFESLIVQKIVLSVLFARLVISSNYISLKQIKYLIIVAFTLDFSSGTAQIVFLKMNLNILPTYSYTVMYVLSLLIICYALFLEFKKNRPLPL